MKNCGCKKKTMHRKKSAPKKIKNKHSKHTTTLTSKDLRTHFERALYEKALDYSNYTHSKQVRTFQVNNHPFLTCFPSFATQRGHTRLSHIRDSTLIMPLVDGGFECMPSTGVLLSGARHSLSRRRCGSRL